MTEKAGDLVQGTLEMLVLKTLALEPMHGYGIALRIEQISDGAFLDAYYVALRGRLEQRLLFGRRRKDKFDAP